MLRLVAFLAPAWASTGLAKVEDIGLASSNNLVEGALTFDKPPIHDDFGSIPTVYSIGDETLMNTSDDSRIPTAVINFAPLDSAISGYLTGSYGFDDGVDPSDQYISIAFFYWPVSVIASYENFGARPHVKSRRRRSCSGAGTVIDIIRCEARDGLFFPDWARSDEARNSRYSTEQGQLSDSSQDGVTATYAIPIGMTDLPAAYDRVLFTLYGGVVPVFDFNSVESFPGVFPGNKFAVHRVADTIPETSLPTMLLIGAGGIALARRKKIFGRVKPPLTALLADHGPRVGPV